MNSQKPNSEPETQDAPSTFGGRRPSSCSVTAEMVRAALDEYVQYMVPVSSVTTPYRVDVQNALQGIADHINKSLNEVLYESQEI